MNGESHLACDVIFVDALLKSIGLLSLENHIQTSQGNEEAIKHHKTFEMRQFENLGYRLHICQRKNFPLMNILKYFVLKCVALQKMF